MKKLSAFLVAVVTGGLFMSAQAGESALDALVRPTMQPEVFFVDTIARAPAPEVFYVDTIARVDVEPGIVVILETAPRPSTISVAEVTLTSPL